MEKTIVPERETSGYVEFLTTVIPFFLIVGLIVSIVAIVYGVKIGNRYLANSKLAEQKFKREEADIQEIKKRLNRIEKNLNETK